MGSTTYLIASYVVVFTLIFAFAAYAMVITWMGARKRSEGMKVEEFITARGTQNKWMIAWSFYAGAVGSWVVVGPASYASYSGLLGLAFYAFSSGIPILFIAFFGQIITAEMPHVLSFTDYVRYRFGVLGQALLTGCVLFNMGVALLAEYVTLGSLFKDYVGSVAWGIIVTLGVLTMSYTVYGGLGVSIITDRIQSLVGVSLALAMVIYLAVDFRYDLPTPLTDDQKGFTLYGYSSIVSMPISLISATICSEAMWQRVWASQDKQALNFGAAVGCFATILIVFFFGFGGFLATWAGLVTENTNPNLYWFALFNDGGDGTVNTWMGVLTMACAAIMSEGAVDSLQNGINATLTSTFLKNKPILWSRICVVVVNVPLMVVASLGLVDSVLSLFLVTNMLVGCVFVPVSAGLMGGAAKKYVSVIGLLTGFVTAVVAVTIYGMSFVEWNFKDGIVYAFYGNMYDYRFFLLAVGASIGGLLGGVGIEYFLQNVCGLSRTGGSDFEEPHPLHDQTVQIGGPQEVDGGEKNTKVLA